MNSSNVCESHRMCSMDYYLCEAMAIVRALDIVRSHTDERIDWYSTVLSPR